jgi:ABC-type antimicrobial peptide transport system permease subunit
VLLAGYDLSGRRVTDTSSRLFAAALLERLNAAPGVEGAAIAAAVPLDIHGLPMRFFTLEGRPANGGVFDEALTNTVTPGYFAVMGLPIVAGTDFAPLRDTAAPLQAVVNQEFARRYAAGRSVLGLRIATRGKQYAIAGVVKNSLYNAFGEPPTPMIYFSYRDRPSATGEIHVRTRPGAETALASDVRAVVGALDPELPVYDVRTLSDHIEANLIFKRIPARMFAVLGPLLLLLAAIGIYAVVAYSVSLRTMEIGVRLALGASTRRVVAQFAGEHLLVVGAGALAGWVAAFAAVVAVLGIPFDPAVFAGVPAVLLVVSAAAAWWPARRVSRVDPMLALRAE